MPALSKTEAAEKLAHGVEQANPADLPEIYSELFPDSHSQVPVVASEIAKHVRSGLEAEEIVDLWNVVFPEDRNVWYDEEAESIHFNEEMVEYAD
jgi:hypothetical protein